MNKIVKFLNKLVKSMRKHFFKDVILTDPASPWVDVRTYSSLGDAITAIGAAECTLMIPTQLTIDSDITIPSNITLLFISSGELNVESGHTVTIQNPVILAGSNSNGIFTGFGSFSFATGSILKSSWFENILDALNKTASSELTLLISRAETLTGNASVGTNVLLQFSGGAEISINAGVVLTIPSFHNISVTPGREVFTGTGAANVTFSTAVGISAASWAGVGTYEIGLNTTPTVGIAVTAPTARVTTAPTFDTDVVNLDSMTTAISDAITALDVPSIEADITELQKLLPSALIGTGHTQIIADTETKLMCSFSEITVEAGDFFEIIFVPVLGFSGLVDGEFSIFLRSTAGDTATAESLVDISTDSNVPGNNVIDTGGVLVHYMNKAGQAMDILQIAEHMTIPVAVTGAGTLNLKLYGYYNAASDPLGTVSVTDVRVRGIIIYRFKA